MRILVTGATGFLGWHTRVRLRATTDHVIVPVGRWNWSDLDKLTPGADAVLHLAGVNRAAPLRVEEQNLRLAEDVARAVRATNTVSRIVYANSIQTGNHTPYGSGKELAGRLLAEVATDVGADFIDVRLPNLFGEHGRPDYNSSVATFVNAVVTGRRPRITDRAIQLLHAQTAAQTLIDGLSGVTAVNEPTGHWTSVRAVYDQLCFFSETYRRGEIPDLADPFAVDLFNTYRAALFPRQYPMTLPTRCDDRGRLVETVRAHGGQGQTFVSMTRPEMTRGEHFHLRKVERFVVLQGSARIALRKVLTQEAVTFDVSGDRPQVIDMPTLWVHNLTNLGPGDVMTLFWTNSLFDSTAPDTFPEKVDLAVETAA